jgi:hypothetical protein
VRANGNADEEVTQNRRQPYEAADHDNKHRRREQDEYELKGRVH